MLHKVHGLCDLCDVVTLTMSTLQNSLTYSQITFQRAVRLYVRLCTAAAYIYCIGTLTVHATRHSLILNI